jgi:hypothetical protein
MMAATQRQIGAAMTTPIGSVAKRTRHAAICSIAQKQKTEELLRRSNAGSNRPRRVSILLAGDALNVGEIEMNADPKRKSDRGPYHPDERVRRHQEEALDDAFKHTFPA